MASLSSVLDPGRRLLVLLRERPHYVFGRFAIARDVYSSLCFARDLCVGNPTLQIRDLYKPAKNALAVTHSGLLVASKSAREQVEEMRAQSFSLGPSLTPEGIRAVCETARTRLLYPEGAGVSCGSFESLAPEQRKRFAFASVDSASEVPAIRAIASDPVLYDAAHLFLRYRPREVSIWLFWSFANELTAEHRRSVYQTIDYHYDVDGMNFMYANFYLLNTTRQNGAHALIVASHRRKRLGQLMGAARISDTEARLRYGDRAEYIVEGSAGSGFLEDASCYHKALPPEAGDRLMLQLRYR